MTFLEPLFTVCTHGFCWINIYIIDIVIMINNIPRNIWSN